MKKLTAKCDKLTRADIESYIVHDWENYIPNVWDYNTYFYEHHQTVYLDDVIKNYIEYRDNENEPELTDKELTALFKWTLKTETSKACVCDW